MNQLRLPLNMPFASSGSLANGVAAGQPTFVSMPHVLTAQQLASIRMPMTSNATSTAGVFSGQSLVGTSIPSSMVGGSATLATIDPATAAAAILQQQQQQQQSNEALLGQLLAQQQQQQHQQHYRTVMEESNRQQQQQAALQQAFQQQNAAIANAQRQSQQQQQQKRRSIDASAVNNNSNVAASQAAQAAAMNSLIQQQHQQQQLKQMQALSGARPLVAASVNNISNSSNNSNATQIAASALAQLGLTNGMMPSVLQLTAPQTSALSNIPVSSSTAAGGATRIQFNPAAGGQQQQEVAGRQLRFSVPGSSGPSGAPGSTTSFSISAAGVPASTPANGTLAAPATSASPSYFISANGMPITNIQLNQLPTVHGARPSVALQHQHFTTLRAGVPVQTTTSVRPQTATLTVPPSSSATTTLSSYGEALLLAQQHANDSARRASGVSAATTSTAGTAMHAPSNVLHLQQTSLHHSAPVNLLTLSNVAAAQPQVPVPSATQQQQQQIFRAAGMPTNIAFQPASGTSFSLASAPKGSIPFGLLQAATNSSGLPIPLLLPQQQTRPLQISSGGNNAVNSISNAYGGARYENISPSPNETPEAQPATTSATDSTVNNFISANFLSTAGGQLQLLQQQQQQQQNQQRQKAAGQQQFVLTNAGSGGGGTITKLQQTQRGGSVVNDFGARPGSSLSKASPATGHQLLMTANQAALTRQQSLVVNGNAAQSRQQQQPITQQQFNAAQQQQQQLLQQKRQSLGHVSVPPNILQQQQLQQFQQRQSLAAGNAAGYTVLQQQNAAISSQNINASPERRAAIEARNVFEAEFNKTLARSEILRKRLDAIRQRQATASTLDTFAGRMLNNLPSASVPPNSGRNNNMLAISSGVDDAATSAKAAPVFVDEIVMAVMDENRNVVQSTHAEKILVSSAAANGLRRSPSNSASLPSMSFSLWPTLQKQSFNIIMKRHSANKRQVIERISQARANTDARLDRLAEMHNRLEKAYIEKSRQAEADFDPKTIQLFENIFPEIRKDRETFQREMRTCFGLRTKAEFDEHEAAEYENLIAPTMPCFALVRNGPSSTLSALHNHASRASREEIMKMKKTKKLVVPVPVGGAFDYLPRGLRYVRTCGFLEDPLQEHKRTLEQLNNWTEYEKDVFKEKFMERPKDFRSISQALPRKSVSDCILYYYARKKQDNFNKPLRRYPTRGGRRGRYNNRTLAQRASATDIAGAGLNGVAAGIGLGGGNVGAAVLRKRGGAGILANGMANGAAGMLLLNNANGAANGGLFSNGASAAAGANGNIANGLFGLNGGISGANGFTTPMGMNGTLGSLGPIGVSTLLLLQQHQQQQQQDASFLDDWSNKEKQAFRRALFQHGTDWVEVGRIVGTRSDYECKRYYELHSETWRPQIELHTKRQRETSAATSTLKPSNRLKDGQQQQSTNAEPPPMPAKKALVAAAVGGGGLKRPITAVAADGEAGAAAKSPKSEAKDSNATLSANDEEASKTTNVAGETAKENTAPNQQQQETTSKKRGINATESAGAAMPTSSSPKRFALDASTSDAHYVANVMTQFASGAVISTSTSNNNNNNNGVIDIDAENDTASNPRCVRDLIHSAIEKNLSGNDVKPNTSTGALFNAFSNYSQQMMVNSSSQPTLILQQQQNLTASSNPTTTQDGLFARQTDYQRLLQQHGAGLLAGASQAGGNAALMMLHPFSSNVNNAAASINNKPPSGSITLGTPNKAAGGILNLQQQSNTASQQQQYSAALTSMQSNGLQQQQANSMVGARPTTFINMQQQQQTQVRPQQQQFMPIISLGGGTTSNNNTSTVTINNNPTTFQSSSIPSGQHAYMIPGTGQIIFVPSNIAAQLQQQPQQQFAIAVSNAANFNAGTNVVRLTTASAGTTLEQQQKALNDALAAASAQLQQQRPAGSVAGANVNNRPGQQQLITIQPALVSSNATPVSTVITSSTGGGVTTDLSHATAPTLSTLSPAQQFMLFQQQQQQQQQQQRPPQNMSTSVTSSATIVSSVAGGGIRPPQFVSSSSSGGMPTGFVFPLHPQQHLITTAQQNSAGNGALPRQLTAGKIIDAVITRQITKDHNPAAVLPATTPSSVAMRSTPLSTQPTSSYATSYSSATTSSPMSTFAGQNKIFTLQQHNLLPSQQISGYTTLPIVKSVIGSGMPPAITSANGGGNGNGHAAIQIIGGGFNHGFGPNRTVATRGALATALPGTTLGDHIEQLIANDITRSTSMSMPTMSSLTQAGVVTASTNAPSTSPSTATPVSSQQHIAWVRAAVPIPSSTTNSTAVITSGTTTSTTPKPSVPLPPPPPPLSKPVTSPATLLITTPLSAVPVVSSAPMTFLPGNLQVLAGVVSGQSLHSVITAPAAFGTTATSSSATSSSTTSSTRQPVVISSTSAAATTTPFDWLKSSSGLTMPPVMAVSSNPTLITNSTVSSASMPLVMGQQHSPQTAATASPFILNLGSLSSPHMLPLLPLSTSLSTPVSSSALSGTSVADVALSSTTAPTATTTATTLMLAPGPPVLPLLAAASTMSSVASTSNAAGTSSAAESSSSATAGLLNGPSIKSPVVVGGVGGVVVPGVVVVAAGNVANSPLPQPDYEPISPPEDTAAHTATSPRDAR